MTGPDPQVGRGDHHRHRGLADVVVVGDYPTLVGRHGNRDGNRGRGPGDVAGAPPDRGQLLQLVGLGDDDEVPRLAVLRRRRAPAGFGDAVQVVGRYRLRLVLPHIATCADRVPSFHLVPSSHCLLGSTGVAWHRFPRGTRGRKRPPASVFGFIVTAQCRFIYTVPSAPIFWPTVSAPYWPTRWPTRSPPNSSWSPRAAWSAGSASGSR